MRSEQLRFKNSSLINLSEPAVNRLVFWWINGHTVDRMDIRITIRRFYAFNFFRQLSFFSAVLVPFFTDWGHISLAQVTVLQSWFMLWVFLLEVPTGAVADYFGRKYSLALGGFVAALGALVYGSVPHIWIFLLGEFLLAAGMALTSGANEALLYDSLLEAGKQDESKRIFARAHTFTLLGIMVAALSGSFIAQFFGLNIPMLVTAIPAFISGLIALSMREPHMHEDVSESKRYMDIVRQGFLFFYRHAQLRLLAIDAIIVAAGGYFVIWLYQPLLQAIHIPLFYFGFGHVILTASEILIAANFIRLEKLAGSAKRYFKLSALLVAFPFVFAAVLPNVWTVLLFITVAGGFGLTRLELMSAYMQTHIPSAQRATVLSSISMFRRFSLVILNPFVGIAATRSLPFALVLVGLLPLSIFLFSPITEEAMEHT